MNDTAYEYEEEVEGRGKEEEKGGGEGLEEKEVNSKEQKATDTSDERGAGEEDETGPAETQARSEGWVDENEWKGDKDDWVDYREFNYRGQLMGRIKSQSTQIHTLMDETKDTKEALKVLGEHNKKIALTEYNRALKDLKDQRKTAREDDDLDALDDIEESIDELKEAKKDLEEEPEKKEKKEQKGLSAEQKQTVQDWYESPTNKWYQDNPYLQPVADKLFVYQMEQNGGNFSNALSYMAAEISKEFPDKVGGKTRKGSSVTESSGRSTGKQKGGSKAKFSAKDLTEEQARVGKTFVNSGVFDNIQEYVEQLATTGELG